MCFSLSSQNLDHNIWRCNTTSIANTNFSSYTKIASVDNEKINKSNKIVNLHLHILRTDDGKQGFSIVEVMKWIDVVKNDYSLHNIHFNIIKISFIDNSYYHQGINDEKFNDLIKTNRSNNALNIYFLSSTDSYSKAESIPSTALVIGGIYKNTSVLSHEIGHCFGLFHTHSGSGCLDFANCEDNGNNCSSCGDYVCDTPPDPCLSGCVNDNCEYTGNKKFNPDTKNIMSYSSPKCLRNLSRGQVHRIHYFLERDFYLKKILCTNPTTSLKTDAELWGFCKKTRFYIENLPDSSTVNWKFKKGYDSKVFSQKDDEIVIDFGTEHIVNVEAHIKMPCGETKILRSASSNNAYIRNEFVHLKIISGDFFKGYKAQLTLTDSEYSTLDNNQTRRFTITDTNDCSAMKSPTENDIFIKPYGRNPSVTFTIGTEDTCEPELATFVIDSSISSFPYLIPTQESKEKEIPAMTDVENCSNTIPLFGQVYTYKRAGARRIYVDFSLIPFDNEKTNDISRWDFSKQNPEISKDYPNGYFECIPMDNSIPYMHPLKIPATDGEIFYDSPRYVGIGDWGNVRIRFVNDCSASQWQLLKFDEYYHTNGYTVDRDKGYETPNLLRVSPNPANEKVYLWIDKNNNEFHNYTRTFSLRTTSVKDAKSPYQIEIYNTQGVLVRSINGNGDVAEVSVEGLPTGVYLVHFNQNNKVYTNKIIVE